MGPTHHCSSRILGIHETMSRLLIAASRLIMSPAGVDGPRPDDIQQFRCSDLPVAVSMIEKGRQSWLSISIGTGKK